MKISDILLERLILAEQNPLLLKEFYKNQSKEDKKKYNEAIECFRVRLNKDRRGTKYKDLTFMPVRMKMYALKELDDLKWAWKVCATYATTRDKLGNRNTFSKAWFGMFDTKKGMGV